MGVKTLSQILPTNILLSNMRTANKKDDVCYVANISITMQQPNLVP